MNHQTIKILDDAKKDINESMCFTTDQQHHLVKLIDSIGEAIAKESDINKPSYTM